MVMTFYVIFIPFTFFLAAILHINNIIVANIFMSNEELHESLDSNNIVIVIIIVIFITAGPHLHWHRYNPLLALICCLFF